LRFNFVFAAHLISALHSSVFARLASGAFYETIVPVTFYEIINLGGKESWRIRKKSVFLRRRESRGFSGVEKI
jgi:hypothetical protein